MHFRLLFQVNWMFGACISATLFLGCYSLEVKDAFDGKYSLLKSNKIINNYCQSCHIHRNFDPREHIFTKRKLYKRKPYRVTKDCRICHYAKLEWAREELIRKTRYPNQVERGLFKEFEMEALKKMKQ